MQSLSEWYFVTKTDLLNAGAFSIVTKYGGLAPTLKELYPDFPWDWENKVVIIWNRAYLPLETWWFNQNSAKTI